MKEKRSDLPDSIFGIPSQRKYPMQDKEHVLSAIKFFNYVDEEHEKELAKNIIKNMKKYDIPFDTVGKKNRLRNYIPKKYLEEKGLIRTLVRDGTIKEDATGNAIVGTNQPDSVYIVNYMQRNAFSGELEEHKGVCKKNMKNIHVFNKVKKKLVPKSLDEFSSMIIGDISVIRTSATDFMHVIENATSESDIDLLIHDSEDPFVQEALDMSSPSEELNLLSEVQILKDAQQELLDSKRYNYRCELPVMETSFSPTNPYNFYTDINGYFIKNEVTGQRSASYFEQVDIPKSVLDHIISL